ncbi:MAG: hydrogenase maturation protease [Xanthomonadales bacterium]|nr:hydrogenase maturation protease [Xanthomonadales bacterium]NIX12899.1 hydrogenase maturation protease [Xanthomonadales bacterium]
MQEATKGTATFLVGIGNSGRRDDGLGWAFLDEAVASGAFDGPVEYRYQLQVEDAAMIRAARSVIFVDASRRKLPGGFRLSDCAPSGNFRYTSHDLPPEAVLHICRELCGRVPPAKLMEIEGLDWGLGEGLSREAQQNLDKALQCFSAKGLGSREPETGNR